MGIYIARVPEKSEVDMDEARAYVGKIVVKATRTFKGPIIDVIDYSDVSLSSKELGQLRAGTDKAGVARSDVQVLIEGTAAPSAVDYVVKQVTAAVGKVGKASLVRVHGHGQPGYQSLWGISKSEYTEEEYADLEKMMNNPSGRQGIGHANLGAIRGSLGGLAGAFRPGGEFWLMGCFVGDGPGAALVKDLAKVVKVPVRASPSIQYSGDITTMTTFLHEHSVVVGKP